MKHLPVAQHILHLSFLVGGALWMWKSDSIYKITDGFQYDSWQCLGSSDVIPHHKPGFKKKYLIDSQNSCFSSYWELGTVGMLILTTMTPCTVVSSALTN